MDREKIIKTLEYCVLSDDCRPCEYWMEFDDTGCQIMKDALALLKEQEEQINNRDESLEKAREEIKWLRGMMKEQEPKQGVAIVKEPDCRICAQHTCRYYHELRKPTECKSYMRSDW